MTRDAYHKLIEKLKQHIIIEDFEPLDIAIATYIANHFQSDPLWLFIIAPSSSAKTEIICSFSQMEDAYFLSDLTDKTLASGYQTGEHSLLTRINNKTVFMKDFTTVLSMRSEKQSEILAQLREIYDGRFDKEWGNKAKINWQGKIGFIAGVTPAIDRTYATYQTLGERFIQVRMKPVDEMQCAKRAMETSGKETSHRQEIAALMKLLLDEVLVGLAMPGMSEGISNKLAALATICVRARTAISRDRYTRDFDYVPEPEAPPRFAKQLTLLAHGLAVLRGNEKVAVKDFETVKRVAFDCMPRVRSRLLQLMMEGQRKISASEAMEELRLSKNVVYRLLEEMVALRLLEKEGSRGSEMWFLSTLVLDCLKVLEFPQNQM